MGNDSDSDSDSVNKYKYKACYGNSAADNVINNNIDYDNKKSFKYYLNNTPNDSNKKSFKFNATNTANTSNKIAVKYKTTYLNTPQKKINNYIDKSIIKFDDINRNPFYINLLHYDENLTNNENQKYYKYFKLNIVGGYLGINCLNMFTYYINAINNSKIFIRYILIISGSNSINVLKLCYNYKFIDEVLIFCNNINNYSYLKSYDKIKIVTNSFYVIARYLKSKSYTSKELDMSNQIPTTPLITFYEYKNCYFAIHRMITKFFNENWAEPYITVDDINSVIIYLNRTDFDLIKKNKIVMILKKLLYSKNFAYDCIREYTGEDLCYIFNKTLRDIGKNFDGMVHFIGPFDYALYKYLKEHPNKGIYSDAILYRDVKMNIFDFYSYFLSLNDVICLPSFTSTTLLRNLNFESSLNAKEVNATSSNDFSVKMVFNYKYSKGNISPGVFIGDISKIKSESEVILFPFTFVKILKIDVKNAKIYFNIVNRNFIAEFALKKGYSIDLDQYNNKLIFK